MASSHPGYSIYLHVPLQSGQHVKPLRQSTTLRPRQGTPTKLPLDSCQALGLDTPQPPTRQACLRLTHSSPVINNPTPLMTETSVWRWVAVGEQGEQAPWLAITCMKPRTARGRVARARYPFDRIHWVVILLTKTFSEIIPFSVSLDASHRRHVPTTLKLARPPNV